LLTVLGNKVYYFDDYRLFTFPTKRRWHEKADLELIARSASQLIALTRGEFREVYLPRPGCGNGGLAWTAVKPILEVLPDKFIVITNNGRNAKRKTHTD